MSSHSKYISNYNKIYIVVLCCIIFYRCRKNPICNRLIYWKYHTFRCCSEFCPTTRRWTLNFLVYQDKDYAFDKGDLYIQSVIHEIPLDKTCSHAWNLRRYVQLLVALMPIPENNIVISNMFSSLRDMHAHTLTSLARCISSRKILSSDKQSDSK